MRTKSTFYAMMTGSTPDTANEAQDCVVRSLALATGVEYDEVHAICAANGRENRRPTKDVSVFAVARQMGLEVVWPSGRPTLAAFIRANPRGSFVLIRSGHAFALINGMVHDWKDGDTGPRSRIRYALKVHSD